MQLDSMTDPYRYDQNMIWHDPELNLAYGGAGASKDEGKGKDSAAGRQNDKEKSSAAASIAAAAPPKKGDGSG
jgi:hypothetical protein